jgi:hypothetical protein
VKFGSIWTSRCRDIDGEAGMHALMQAVRKGVASERYVLDSTNKRGTQMENCLFDAQRPVRVQNDAVWVKDGPSLVPAVYG